MRCADCGHVFTSGYFNDAALRILFGHTQEQQTVGHDFERHRHVSARMIGRVAHYQPDGAWLDVGFGNGSLILTAAEWGYRAVGIDLRSANVAALRGLGCEAHELSVEALEGEATYSVISMADVLEHMPYPETAVAAAARLLSADGVIFISLPAYASPIWRLLDSSGANPYWSELEHYHNFSRARLCDLLAGHGFQLLEYGVSERYRACMELIFRRTPLA